MLGAVGTPWGTAQALLRQPSAKVTREIYLHSVPVDGFCGRPMVGNQCANPPDGEDHRRLWFMPCWQWRPMFSWQVIRG